MRSKPRVVIISVLVWVIGFYTYAAVVIWSEKSDHALSEMAIATGDYWSPNPSLSASENGWDTKIWKWREYLDCGSAKVASDDQYNYAIWKQNSVRVSVLSGPDLDWVYVAGVSTGNVWNDPDLANQPTPLPINEVSQLTLETRIDKWKGVPLSPIIFPSWYAVLGDLWFNVTDVTIVDENGTETHPSKILGIDIFYHTMTGKLNAIMGASDEFARVEPCNKNFIYSINLNGQDFYEQNKKDGSFSIDILSILTLAQKEAADHGWIFEIDNVELVMMETVIESYWSYVYADIGWSGIKYCLNGRSCVIE